MNRKVFRELVWNYYRRHGRDLPWRPPTLPLRRDKILDPYRILVSEVMLQQTQVSRVIPKYVLFLKRFPGTRLLARASLRDVLRAWQGLGYNRRALFLHRVARTVIEKYKGKIPEDAEVLKTLPGIGEGTAGAIGAFAFNKPTIFIETNIRRVFLHFFFTNRKKVRDEEILFLIEKTLDQKSPREWYWALMDYGAILGKEAENPNRRSAHYAKQSPFRGSERELRGKILRFISARKWVSIRSIARACLEPINRVEEMVKELRKEGFVTAKKGEVWILTK